MVEIDCESRKIIIGTSIKLLLRVSSAEVIDFISQAPIIIIVKK